MSNISRTTTTDERVDCRAVTLTRLFDGIQPEQNPALERFDREWPGHWNTDTDTGSSS